MCNFFSALGTPKGDILWHWNIDSHTDLMTHFGIADDKVGRYAKLELEPGSNWLDPETWDYSLDQPTKPGWYDEVANTLETKMRAVARGFVIATGERRLIVDGVWIVGGDANVYSVRGGRIVRLQDSATIFGVWGGTISGVWGGTISDVWGGTISRMWGGTISGVWGGTISEVWGGTISRVWGGTISRVWDSDLLDNSAKARVLK